MAMNNKNGGIIKRIINIFSKRSIKNGRINNDFPKFMNIKEFRESGYLQEVNRQFLHPLGLALTVFIDDETGEEELGGIWDYREDPEGIYFNYMNRENDQIIKAIIKREFIKQEFQERSEVREDLFGDIIEPINPKKKNNGK